MRRSVIGICLAVAVVLGSVFAVASPEDPQRDNIYAGLWREGQAVFSDWKLLDILWRGTKRGDAPTQPLAFNHKIHVEKNQMECQYCHSGVSKSGYATIPSVETCMGCHKTAVVDRPDIKKLHEYFNEKKAIEWEPVHSLPEHAVFSHERHMKAGVSCQNCHGQVQKMDVVEKASSLKMGFCVSCHREQGASIDCATCHY